ncbi:dolichyl-phosphate-mannose--protein mannosyltransferase [Demequina sp. NBRC 110053]|uniref:dolichyl-phosphate-mannose--protein mannosyltransferase n=1 Tax=Demequina sp. NBRC 110053 TaxID=1570342 RepID=UPI000A067A79|nr:phospholipid carrier-dependent glycosyltransferase [Demequina sp. NBRC 110053]
MIVETAYRWRVALMAVSVAALAALLRFANLGSPQALVFDEVFYARGAYSLLTQGFEGEWGGENQDFASGDVSQLSTDGDYVVHPMVGKLLIALGMQMFGPTPFGWRFMGALLGVITVVMVAFIARHLLRSTLWGTVAGVLLAVDGAHIVLSRTALLDIYLTFFVVAGFALLLVDRARTRRRLLSADAVVTGLGPRTGVRWWRLAAIVSFGLATGVKWSGLWFAAAFLLLSVIWDWADRREAGAERWFAGGLVRGVAAFVATLVLLPLTYLATWIPWFRSPDGYGRDWAAEHPGEGVTWLPDGLNSLLHYHQTAYEFHRTLDSPHNYESNPWLWIIQYRPTAFYFEDVVDVDCGADRCVSAIHAIGNPLIWWAGAIVLAYALWRIVVRRDLLALTVATGVLAAWLPWLPYAHRTIFTFYTVAMAPFLVLVLVWGLSRLAQPARLAGRWWPPGAIAAAVFVSATIVVAGFFAPIWIGDPIPFGYWQLHMWLPSWV